MAGSKLPFPETPDGDRKEGKNISIVGTLAGVMVWVLANILVSQRYILQSSNWPMGSKGEHKRYILLDTLFAESLSSGELYPRWMPDLFYGYGYPTFVFYPPGYFYLSSFVGLFTDLLLSMDSMFDNYLYKEWITLDIVLCVGGYGAFLLAGRIGGVYAGLLGAVMFLFSPYLMVDLQIRGDLTELLALCLCPYPFYFFLKVIDEVKAQLRGCVMQSSLLGVSLSLPFVCHPAVALILCVMFTFYAAAVIVLESNAYRVRILQGILVALGLLLGLAISAPYWFHVFQLKPFVNLASATTGYFNIDNWIAKPVDFYLYKADELNAYYVGIPHLLLATSGFIMSYRNPRIRVAFIIYGITLMSFTGIGSGVWSYFELLRYIQFPWRAQSVLITLQVICISGVLATYFKHYRWPGYASIVMIIITCMWYSDALSWQDKKLSEFSQNEVRKMINWHLESDNPSFNSMSDRLEFAPLTAIIPGSENSVRIKNTSKPRNIAMIESGEGELHPAGSSKHRIKFVVKARSIIRVKINQVYFPGWLVAVDGEPVDDEVLAQNAREEGLIVFDLGPGTHSITAYYSGPPRWRDLTVAIVFAVIILFLLKVVAFRRYAGQNAL
ncbi:MAG: hypothetical protein OEZ28_10940, partial [Nitrospinota bacterium]|nr:hypothetical protein [Nitrospinota bacterium]